MAFDTNRWATRAGRPFAVALVAVAVAGTCAIGAARADTDRIEKRLWVAVSGKAQTVVVDSFREMREDCSAAPAPALAVTKQPKLAKLTVKTVTAPGTTDPTGPYAACNGKKFNWSRVTWPVPTKGEGTDSAVIQATESSGDVTVYDFEIVYAKKLPAGKTSGLVEDR
ncbi:hypothetical protein EYW49_18115 [Siculibacillus lacustris]|uniref:Uncharacterized protein n=1 Tax=Siculibacillus lacustris TaxID=1549641 RepID=A0A4Q9VHW0_9HYPH|nr:hypothetical protein [Siculibacillus lacustris]TBW34502.1 hypothetical protein EYW49_18115 [Siculibacillus lacustris]